MQQQITCIAPIDIADVLNRSAAYVRVSTKKEDQQNSFAAQYLYYHKMLEESETEELVEVYADEGITGTSMQKRDNFNRMIADCEKGKIDRIYCKSISRFARNTTECLKIIRHLKSLGVTVYFEKEKLDTAIEETEFRLTMMEYQAQEESISISKNVRIGERYRMEQGDYLVKNAPYGYRRYQRTLVICEDEAVIVRRIFNEYANGKGVRRIAKDLNDEGVPRNNEDNVWRVPFIKYLLSNEKYIGDQMYLKRYRTETFPFERMYNHGEHESYYVEESHEPIVDRELFERVQALKESKIPKCVTEEYEKYTLSGRIHCTCGTTMRTKMTSSGRAWACRLHDEDGLKCKTKPVLNDEVIRAFINLYNKLKANKKVIIQPIITQLVTLKNSIASTNTEYASIDERILLCTEQISILTKLRKDKLIDEETFIRKNNEMNNSLNSLRSQRRLFLNNSDADVAITNIKRLSATIDKGPAKLTEFDEDLFDTMVEDVLIGESNSVKFKLTGGLTIKEKIERVTR